MMAEKDDVNVPMIATVGVVSVLLTIATVYAVQALYFERVRSENERKVVLAPTADADSRLAEQEAKITRYSWIKRGDGIVAIPIDRAMQLIVDEYRGKKGANVNLESSPRRSD